MIVPPLIKHQPPSIRQTGLHHTNWIMVGLAQPALAEKLAEKKINVSQTHQLVFPEALALAR
jgi:hypothetical protein